MPVDPLFSSSVGARPSCNRHWVAALAIVVAVAQYVDAAELAVSQYLIEASVDGSFTVFGRPADLLPAAQPIPDQR